MKASEELSVQRLGALHAIESLVDHVTELFVCVDLLAVQGKVSVARELRGMLVRATAALSVLRTELATIELVERCLVADEKETLFS